MPSRITIYPILSKTKGGTCQTLPTFSRSYWALQQSLSHWARNHKDGVQLAYMSAWHPFLLTLAFVVCTRIERLNYAQEKVKWMSKPPCHANRVGKCNVWEASASKQTKTVAGTNESELRKHADMFFCLCVRGLLSWVNVRQVSTPKQRAKGTGGTDEVGPEGSVLCVARSVLVLMLVCVCVSLPAHMQYICAYICAYFLFSLPRGPCISSGKPRMFGDWSIFCIVGTIHYTHGINKTLLK